MWDRWAAQLLRRAGGDADATAARRAVRRRAVRRPTDRVVRRRPAFEPLESRALLAAFEMTDGEQLLVELINRGRANPAAEAARYGVDLNAGLPAGTIAATAKQPLAPHQALITAAGAHSQDMLDNDYFAHIGLQGSTPGTRIAAAGYAAATTSGENIAWSGSTGPIDPVGEVYGVHESLFLSPSHRRNLMSPSFRELGVGVRFGQFEDGETYNAVMATENFAARSGAPFLTGVVFSDAVTADDFYTVGEGLGGVTITATVAGATTGTSTTTSASGGYSLALPAGTYEVVASGGPLAVPRTRTGVVIGATNVKVDFEAASGRPPEGADDLFATDVDVAATFDPLANDSDPDGDLQPSTLQILVPPSRGQATIQTSTGRIDYVPSAGAVGVDAFTYRVQDAAGAWSAAVRAVVVINPAQRSAWTNPRNYLDVDDDGHLVPLDALLVINELNGHLRLPANASVPATPPPAPAYFLDVDGDAFVAPLDALQIINVLNAGLEGEGEQAASAPADGDLPGESNRGVANWGVANWGVANWGVANQAKTNRGESNDAGRTAWTPVVSIVARRDWLDV